MTAPLPPLPHGLQLIADVAGIEAAVALALTCGGSRVFIPRDAAGSVLAGHVGLDAARKLADAYGGDRLDIPHGKRALSGFLRARGLSQERRAVLLKVARRTIQNWDSAGAPSPENDLFSGL